MTARNDHSRRPGLSRRRLLGTLGAGAASAVALGPRGLLESAPAAAAPRPGGCASSSPQHFGRLFPQLPPFAERSDAVVAALREIGRPGGMLDARDALDRGPVDLITDPALSLGNPNNPTHTAGTTFLGQFLDHDITFDASSRLGHATSPQATRNARTPTLDLDSVYGAGPVADQVLYDGANRAKLRVEDGGLYEDLPRGADGRALIADPRNDEHLVIAGLHCAFLLLHNRVVDEVRAHGRLDGTAEVFAEARRIVTWHWQWIVLHELLPLLIGQAEVDRILRRGRDAYRPARGEAFMPVEFQGAAYRFGHSMVRPSYRANLAGDEGRPFFGMIFDPSQEGAADPSDLRGGVRSPRRFVGWQTFFDFGDGQVKPNKRIDTKLSTPLFHLPLGAIASHDGPTSLPQRNLLRHLTWELPSGQRIARHLGLPVLGAADLDTLGGLGAGLERSTPLWLYVLREAELVAEGLHLGPVGGRIVGEVVIGLLQEDPGSFLAAQPGWRPTLPPGGDGFRMTDLLRAAGVDPASRGQ